MYLFLQQTPHPPNRSPPPKSRCYVSFSSSLLISCLLSTTQIPQGLPSAFPQGLLRFLCQLLEMGSQLLRLTDSRHQETHTSNHHPTNQANLVHHIHHLLLPAVVIGINRDCASWVKCACCFDNQFFFSPRTAISLKMNFEAGITSQTMRPDPFSFEALWLARDPWQSGRGLALC